MPAERPDLDPALYPARVARLRERMATERYTHLVVYADREHSANLSYLTGFDPRFEEAILILGRDGEPAILVGNECWGMAGAAPLPMRRHRFQDLSLPSQPRDKSRPLREILGDEGIGTGAPGRRHRLEVVRGPRAHGDPDLPRGGPARADGSRRPRGERRGPPHGTPPTACARSTRWTSWRPWRPRRA